MYGSPNRHDRKGTMSLAGGSKKNAFRGHKPFFEEVKSPSSSRYHLIPEEITKRVSANKTTKINKFAKKDELNFTVQHVRQCFM